MLRCTTHLRLGASEHKGHDLLVQGIHRQHAQLRLARPLFGEARSLRWGMRCSRFVHERARARAHVPVCDIVCACVHAYVCVHARSTSGALMPDGSREEGRARVPASVCACMCVCVFLQPVQISTHWRSTPRRPRTPLPCNSQAYLLILIAHPLPRQQPRMQLGLRLCTCTQTPASVHSICFCTHARGGRCAPTCSALP